METSDFSGASRHIFGGLSQAVSRGMTVRPVFVCLAMDPATPGEVVEADTLLADSLALRSGFAEAPSPALAVEKAFKQLLTDPGSPASLVGLVRGATVKVPGGAKRVFTLELRSADAAAATAFPVLGGRGARDELQWAPLIFRRLARPLPAG